MRGILLFTLLGLGMVDAASAADFSFGPPLRVTLARHATDSVAIGDANGDGRKDLVVSEYASAISSRGLSLFLQRADGSLAPPVRMVLENEANSTFPVAFADLNGDGAEEIMVGTGTRLLVARLAGGVLAPIVTGSPRYSCDYIASGDIDADGKMDVVCQNGVGTPTIATLFYGNGTGGFRAKTDLVTGAGSYGFEPDFMTLKLADATGDGRLDLLVTASRVSQFFVYPNDGKGGISPVARAYTHPWSPALAWPAALEVLDIDGDGTNEVVTASPNNQPGAMLNVYRQSAGGYLVLSERLPTYDSTTALLAADLEGDGDKELVTGHYAFNAVTVRGANSAGITRQERYELPGFSLGMAWFTRQVGRAKSLALGDVNGDGCVDLAAATISGTTLLLGCRPFSSRLPANDVDGDGVSDLLWLDESSKQVHLWEWADIEAWRRCLSPCPQYKVPPWVVQTIGDFDGDGNSDVFWRNRNDGANAIIRAAFYEQSLTTVTSQDWQVVGSGDFDGDDQSDLLWRNSRTGANTIWKSADYNKQQAAQAVDLSWQVAGIGDFNGDGRSDILWRHGPTGRNALWLSGRFDTQQAITAVTNLQWRVQGIGDFNADGKDDVVWYNSGTGASAIWLSADYRTQQAVTTVTNLDWKIASVGDYNADGRSDLVWRNSRTGANVIWRSARYETQQQVAAFEPWNSLLY